jgi:type III secretion system (T3SS) SseB-like protein
MGTEGGSSGSLLWILCIALLVITTTVGVWHSVSMASFKSSSSRKPQQLTVPAIKFVGEQDGPPERDLKARLIKLFRDRPSVERAYLARTEYPDATGMQVTLCVVSSTGEDKSLVSQVSDIFGDMFGAHEHLDILFIRDEQEQQLRAVCMPFYKPNS